jgi:hypothetical protein
MRRELIGDDFETVHLRPKDADIVLQNYARDYQEFDQTVTEIAYLFDNHVLLDDDQYPMSTTELNKTVSYKYGFSKKDQLPREAKLIEALGDLLEAYDLKDSNLGHKLRNYMEHTILVVRNQYHSDKK